jgi:hypothetical protein
METDIPKNQGVFGRREGAGRPWGSRDRVKRRSASIAEIATRDALAFMQTNDMQIFEGVMSRF